MPTPSPCSLAALTPMRFFNAFFASTEYSLCRKGNRCVKTESAKLRVHLVSALFGPDLCHYMSRQAHRYADPVPLLFGCTNTYAIFQCIFRFHGIFSVSEGES